MDSQPAAKLALQGRDTSSTKPIIRMCFQAIQVKKKKNSPPQQGMSEASTIKLHRRIPMGQEFLCLAGTRARSLSSWIRISGMAFGFKPKCGSSHLFPCVLGMPWAAVIPHQPNDRGDKARTEQSQKHQRRGSTVYMSSVPLPCLFRGDL